MVSQRGRPSRLVQDARKNRTILTFDLGFGELVALSGQSTVSVIVFRLDNARSDNVIRRIDRVLKQSADELEKGAIIAVEERRHRIRLLPIGRR